MVKLLFKIFPVLRKHMSERTSYFLFGFSLLALILFGLWKESLSGFKESSNTLFYLFLAILSLIPISFIISWVFDVKHAWDMRIVAVDDPNPKCSSFPQNAIYAKKQGCKFRKPTKKERVEWGLNKKRNFKTIIKELMFTTQKDLKEKRINEKLHDPDTPIDEWMKIRNKQKNIEKHT